MSADGCLDALRADTEAPAAALNLLQPSVPERSA